MPDAVDDRLPAGLERLACLAGRRWHAVDLPGGLTNRNLRVRSTDDGEGRQPLDLVVRCSSGDPGLLGIDRDAEHDNTRAAAQAGVGAPVVEYRPDLAMLVIGHLEGVALTDASFDDAAVLERAAGACRRLHAGPRFTGDFDMFARQAAYRRTVHERGFAVPRGYDEHEHAWQQVCRALAATAGPMVPCNNDLLAANFIDDVEHRAVWLIDYEYSGNNDPCFELGNTSTECNLTPDQTEAYVRAYFDDARPSDLARVRLQALVSEYGWSLWGFIQAGASELDFDFAAWGQERFDKADRTFRSPLLARLLEDVSS